MNRQSPLLAIVRKSALGALLGLSLTSDSLLGQTSTITELKTLGGTAITGMALNNVGQVTGYSRIAGDAEQHAFFYQAGATLDIGTLGGPFSQGNAINNSGQVAGLSWTSSFQTRAFLYSNGTMKDLDTLGGSFSVAFAINNAGQVVGQSDTSAYLTHAFRYAAGQMEDLGTLGGSYSSASAINNSGQVTGDSSTSNSQTHAFLYSAGAMIDLGTLGGNYSTASGVNNLGQVAGESAIPNFDTHAFLYSDGAIHDLGTLGGSYSTAYALNDSGQVIGDSSQTGDFESHAFLFSGATMNDLGTLGGYYSTASAINNLGQVVGDSATATGRSHAFLSQNGMMIDLNSLLPANSGWELWSAFYINEASQIVGYGDYQQQSRWYVLALAANNRPPVAEAGPDQTIECAGETPVVLDGSGSSDPDGDTVNFEWREADVLLGVGERVTLKLPFGAHIITLKVTDPSNESAHDTIIVSVVDTTAPTMTCPQVLSASAGDNCQATLPNVLTLVTASDNCTSAERIVLVQSPSAGTLVGIGTHAITVTAMDDAGNTATCTTTFTVLDTTPPTVTCPQGRTASADGNCQSGVPDFLPDAVASDNCTSADKLSIIQSPAIGTLVGIGTHLITVTAKDEAGNIGTCTTTFTVRDTGLPTITCPPVPNVSADGNSKAVLPDLLAGVTASDNCTPAGELALTQSPTPGTVLGVGTYVVTVTATDEAGNMAVCTTTFTVQDTTPPVLTAPQSLILSANGNSQATVPDVVSRIIVSDNCTAANKLVVDQSPAAGTLVGMGTHLITVTAKDAAGNMATCTTTFTVKDTTPPTIICPPSMISFADVNGKALLPNLLAGVTASDNCTPAGNLALTQSPTPGTILGIGGHVVILTAADEAGNIAVCSTTFAVHDTTPPVLACPKSLSQSANKNSQAVVPDVVSLTIVSDNCTAADKLVVVQSPAAGALVGMGSHVITVIATDEAGNTSTCATTLTVADTTAPTINSVTASPNVLSQSNHQMVPVAVYVSATDNCDPAPACQIVSVSSDEPVTGPGDNTTPDWIITGKLTVNLRAEYSSKSASRAYTITVNCTDASGNTSLRTVIVNVTKQKNKP
jgi:probable HAF family extracellular repeat protein